MSKLTKLLIALAIIALACGVALVVLPDSEPSYSGRTLSQWFAQYEQDEAADWRKMESERTSHPAEAIRHIGTNAIPITLRWISYESPAYLVFLRDNIEPNTAGPTPVLHIGENRAHRATEIFHLLGTNGVPAIPALTKLVVDSNRVDSARNAAIALAYIGRPGKLALISILLNKTNAHRPFAIGFLMETAHEDRDIIEPAMVECLKDSDWHVSLVASNYLRRLDDIDARPRPSR